MTLVSGNDYYRNINGFCKGLMTAVMTANMIETKSQGNNSFHVWNITLNHESLSEELYDSQVFTGFK